jgi:hypothetical protein
LATWYPGDAYVDIIGQDHYPMDDNHGAAKDVFDELSTLTRGRKLIGLGENGPIPDPAVLVRDQAGWLFFTTWMGSILFEKTRPEQLREYYNNPYVENLGDLPDLKNYPFKPAGKAVKLGFAGAPGDVAIGGTWRSPVAVTVQDENGRTVRDGSYSVTLTLTNSEGAKLSGAATGETVNGIATFPDAHIEGGCGRCDLLATAEGLRAATGADFHAGPGNGLVRESRSGPGDVSGPPAATEVLRQALETPVSLATNFSARIRGVLIAPQTGDYKFWVAAGGATEFCLGLDGTNLVKIAAVSSSTPYRKWPHINEAESQPFALTAGRKYPIEIRQRQPNGSTQLFVRWRLPDGTEERPIPAFRFAVPEN